MSSRVETYALAPKSFGEGILDINIFSRKSLPSVTNLYQLGLTLFGTASGYGSSWVSGSSIPAGSTGTVLAIGYCALFGGSQLQARKFLYGCSFHPYYLRYSSQSYYSYY